MKRTRLTAGQEVPLGTHPYVVKTGEWRFRRPVIDGARCQRCASCFLHCPVQCIRKKGDRFEADLDYCKGCGICAYGCPAFAITLVEEKEE